MARLSILMNQQLALYMVKVVPGGAIAAAVRTNPIQMFRSMLTGELFLAGTKDLLKTASAGIVMSAVSFVALLEWKFALGPGCVYASNEKGR